MGAMMAARYAEVAVDAPLPPERMLTYAIPPGMSVAPGQAVWAPLQSRRVSGVVFSLADHTEIDGVRFLGGVQDAAFALSSSQLALARWLSRETLCSLYEAAALMLPWDFRRRLLALLRTTDKAEGADLSHRSDEERRLLARLHRTKLADERRLVRSSPSRTALRRLMREGLVVREWRWERPRATPQYRATLRLAVSAEEARRHADDLPDASRRQKDLLEYLAGTPSMDRTAARKEFGPPAVKALEDRGLVAVEQRRHLRDPLAGRSNRRQAPLHLTARQAAAVEAITASLQRAPLPLTLSLSKGPAKAGTSTAPVAPASPLGGEAAATAAGEGYPPAVARADGRSFLLLGVTGSGKTEVYLQALARCIAQGRRGLYLVPEIALTPQLTARLLGRFPGRVGLIHSGLSLGQQYDAWWRIHRGDFDVVLGSRSAIFAPVPDLGLVILDEEHEWTYKQQDVVPRYHARDTALKLAELIGTTVVLGSATPDLVAHRHAVQGRHRLLELPERLAPGPGGRARTVPLPTAQIVDMREELKAGVRSIFSRSLQEALRRTLERGEQAILFLNRRGASGIVQCRDCGHVLHCRSCDAPLTYHAVGDRMVCHYCGRRTRRATRCPECRGSRIRHLGIGTQRVVQEVERTFSARVLRWDRDAARGREAHEGLMDSFSRGEADVLVGTQMVAKGLDLPRVTLVGAILADLGLHLPDFRSAERAFQLLCQVAGRAGRIGGPGLAIIQTYSPEHYGVRLAATQDYAAFAAEELDFRHAHTYPPFSRLGRLLFEHTNPAYAQREAASVAARIRAYCARQGLGEVDVIGPAPAYPPRVRGRYRWHMAVRVPVGAPVDLPALLASLPPLPGWRVDVDPVSLA